MATKYVHFTEDQKERARLTDLADLLCRQGHTLKRSGSEYEWKNGGAKITIGGTCGITSMSRQAEMPLTLCGGFMEWIIQRRWNISWVTIAVR